MNSLQFLSHLIELYGLYAVFFLSMIEGDITLLLAGVLAHNDFFGSYRFARVLLLGTLGGFASDKLAFAVRRACHKTGCGNEGVTRSGEHTSGLQSLNNI